jgi:hypothetical protein
VVEGSAGVILPESETGMSKRAVKYECVDVYNPVTSCVESVIRPRQPVPKAKRVKPAKASKAAPALLMARF